MQPTESLHQYAAERQPLIWKWRRLSGPPSKACITWERHIIGPIFLHDIALSLVEGTVSSVAWSLSKNISLKSLIESSIKGIVNIHIAPRCQNNSLWLSSATLYWHFTKKFLLVILNQCILLSTLEAFITPSPYKLSCFLTSDSHLKEYKNCPFTSIDLNKSH